MASISGSVTIAGDPDDWIAVAWDADTHAYAGVATVSGGAYTISGLTAGKAYVVGCRPKSGPAWTGERITNLNDIILPSTPTDAPFVFKATSAAGNEISAQYWRVNSFVTTSGVLEISEIQLHSGSGNENGNATITGTTPYAFPFTNLYDNTLTTRTYWNTTTNVYVKWAFSNAVSITGLKIGSYDTLTDCPSGLVVQYSDNNTDWTTAVSPSGIVYPSTRAYADMIAVSSPPLTGTSEPTWPSTLSDTVVDGDVTWTNMGSLVRPLMQGPLIAA